MTIPLLVAIIIFAVVIVFETSVLIWALKGREAGLAAATTAQSAAKVATDLMVAAQAAEVVARQESAQLKALTVWQDTAIATLQAQVRAHESGGDRVLDQGHA